MSESLSFRVCLFTYQMTDYRPIVPRKPLALGSFFLALLAVTALFVPAFSAQLAVMNRVSIDAAATDYALSEDGEQVVVDIRVRNPTRSAFTAGHGQLYGQVGDEQLTGLGVEVEKTTIPPGETATVTARISVADGHREEMADAIESGQLEVTGQLEGTIQDEHVRIEVEEETDG